MVTGLVERLKQGDEAAFNQVYLSYHKKVFTIAENILKDSSRAEDVVQEVFIKVFRHISSLKNEKGLTSWILKIADNTSKTHFKRNKADISYDVLLELSSNSENMVDEDFGRILESFVEIISCPDESCLRPEKEEIEEKLEDAYAFLPDKLREYIILADVEGMTSNEIAKHLGCTKINAEVRVCEARKLIRENIIENSSN